MSSQENRRTVYMDNNATTPIHPEVAEGMKAQLDNYGNPSSMHESGRRARQVIETARMQTAALIGADPMQIIFTSGGSESNNTVLKQFLPLLVQSGTGAHGADCSYDGRVELVTSTIEHPSVLETVEYIGRLGVPVQFIPVDETGKIDLDALQAACSEKTALVSVMFANNEIGTVQDIRRITEIAHEAGALMHTDAVQAAGKLPVDVQALGVDFLSLSGHKIYGPKGVGALYIRDAKNSRFAEEHAVLLHGGHQEHHVRAGTHNTLGIAGLGMAAELAGKEMAAEMERLAGLKNRLKQGIAATIPEIRINGHESDTLPGTLDISFLGAEGESILLNLDFEGIAISTGSACATGSLEPSHVLLAIGLDAEYAHGSIRFSLGRENTEADVDYVLEKLPPIIERIRKMSTRYIGGAK